LVDLVEKSVLQQPLDQAKSETIGRLGVVLNDLEQCKDSGSGLQVRLNPIKHLREIDPEFEVALSQPQMRLFRQLGNKVTDQAERLFEEIRRVPPNGLLLRKMYQDLEGARWMDDFPTNLGRVASALEDTRQHFSAEISAIETKRKRLFDSRNYAMMADCCETLNQLESLSDVDPLLREQLEQARNSYVAAVQEILQEVTLKCESKGANVTHLLDDETADVFTFKQAGRILKQLHALEPVVHALSLEMTAKMELEELIIGKAKRLVAQIRERSSDYAFMAAVLEAMEILPRMSFIPEVAQNSFSRARNAVISELEQTENAIEVLISQGELLEAEKLVLKFAESRRLMAVLTVDGHEDVLDISGKIKKLQMSLISSKKEVVESIPLKFSSRQFQLLKQEISGVCTFNRFIRTFH